MMISLTVDVEEGFHGLWPSFHRTIEHPESPRGVFIKPLKRILNLFEEYHVGSTFFVLGEIAEAFPEIVEEIYGSGHEVASHGYSHVDFTKVSLSRFEEIERKNRSILAKITGEVPIGFRAPFARINPAIVSLLSRIGYVYDCSIVPSLGIPGWWRNYGAPLSPYRVGVGEKDFFEVPIAVFPYLRFPICGGWFLRNFGVTYVKIGIKCLLSKGIPAIVYFHPFDVNPDAQKSSGFRFHITRRCGEYALEAIRNLLETFDCPKVPIRDVLRDPEFHEGSLAQDLRPRSDH